MKKFENGNNKGFSLVELIVVIAIMVVLVAVLAPQFTKYVEQSRRATDIQNANSIAEAVLADAADGTITTDIAATKVVANNPSAIKSEPKTKGNAVAKDANFMYEYDLDTNTVKVYVEGSDTNVNDLTDETKATAYKNATSAGQYKAAGN